MEEEQEPEGNFMHPNEIQFYFGLPPLPIYRCPILDIPAPKMQASSVSLCVKRASVVQWLDVGQGKLNKDSLGQLHSQGTEGIKNSTFLEIRWDI